MGGGIYDFDARQTRAVTQGYHTKSAHELFNDKVSDEMLPQNIGFREARDSVEHPNSIPIILGLDETASMGYIPHHLVKEGLPRLMNAIIENGIPDPQLLFLGVGDHRSDQFPLQVGQFESSDDMLDKWLTDVYLEGNGGGNGGESYFLAWYFAAYYTQTDHFEKRGQKGILFTIGDEPVHKTFSVESQERVFGRDREYEALEVSKILKDASEKYDIYHIHTTETFNGGKTHYRDGWKELLGENLLIAYDHTQIPELIARVVAENVNKTPSTTAKSDTEEKVVVAPDKKSKKIMF